VCAVLFSARCILSYENRNVNSFFAEKAKKFRKGKKNVFYEGKREKRAVCWT